MSYKTFNEFQESDHQEEILWKDRKRILGLPLSFTVYTLSNERLVRKTGLLNTETDEVLLYRIMDIEMKQSFGQRIFGVGSVILHASDRTTPTLQLENIKKPADVKRYLSRLIETVRDEKQITGKEMFGAAASYSNTFVDRDGDGIPDYMQMDLDGDGVPDFRDNPVYSDEDEK